MKENRGGVRVPEDSGKNKAINIRIPPEEKEALVKYCQGRGLKMAWVIKEAIKKYITD